MENEIKEIYSVGASINYIMDRFELAKDEVEIILGVNQ